MDLPSGFESNQYAGGHGLWGHLRSIDPVIWYAARVPDSESSCFSHFQIVCVTPGVCYEDAHSISQEGQHVHCFEGALKQSLICNGYDG